jgi:hypothetical protein
MLWLGSFTVLYSYPVVFYHALDIARSNPESTWLARVQASGPWACQPALWVPMVLALLVPRALHEAWVRRIGSPFVLRRQVASVTHDYRSPQPWEVVTSERTVRRLAALYAGRLGLAMGISALSFRVLMHTRFVENYGCVIWPYVRTVPEHLTFVTLLLAVAAYHVPTTRRVLGRPPRVGGRGD